MGTFIHKLVQDFRTEAKLARETIREDSRVKFGRIYERFDNYKDHLENTHTRKEVCLVMHDQIKDRLDVSDAKIKEVGTDVKEILKRIKFNGNSQ